MHSIVGDTGYFVDVGAEDGVTHNNTYALEQLGWTGICVEPNVQAYEKLRANRAAVTYQFAASDHHGAIAFDGVRLHKEQQAPYDAVPVAPLWSLLAAHAPPVIDFLSIDTEGHELEVLAGMDFVRWHVRVATIEHNSYCDGPARKDAIAAVMVGHGFDCYADDIVAEGYGEYESWWIHRDG